MQSSQISRFRNSVGIVQAIAAIFVVLGLNGCASKIGGTDGGAQQEILTESDEPDTRKRARIRLELAVGYFEQGQTTVALDELKQSLAADPNFAEALNLRGLIYMRLNDPRLAEESFRRALTISPKDPNVLHNYGWMLCQHSRFAESQQVFSQVVANPFYGGRAKSWMAQGLCQIKAGQASDAELSLQRSYELDLGTRSQPITFHRSSFSVKNFLVPSFMSGGSTTVSWQMLSHYGWASRLSGVWTTATQCRSWGGS